MSIQDPTARESRISTGGDVRRDCLALGAQPVRRRGLTFSLPPGRQMAGEYDGNGELSLRDQLPYRCSREGLLSSTSS